MQISPIEKQAGAQASPHSVHIIPTVEQQQQMFLEVTPRFPQALTAPPSQASLSRLLYDRSDRLIPIGASPLPDWNQALLPSLGSIVVLRKTYRGDAVVSDTASVPGAGALASLTRALYCCGAWNCTRGLQLRSAGVQACDDAFPRACVGLLRLF